MNLFYKPKHAKPNPLAQRFKNSPKWILFEIKWYICFWKDLLLKIGNFIIDSGVAFIDWQDNLDNKIYLYWESNPDIKIKFENFKKFCYNIYIRLRKEKKDIRYI